jgi:hypothetical protein
MLQRTCGDRSSARILIALLSLPVARSWAAECPPPPELLVDPAATSEDGVGTSVALRLGEDPFVLLGNPTNDFVGTNSGSVVMLRPSWRGWMVVDTFTAPDTDADDRFGSSLALRRETLVVGSPTRTVGSLFSAGSVSLFRYKPGSDALDWVHEGDLLSPDPDATEQFGNAVATDGVDTVVVGNAADSLLGAGVGSAHVYRRDGGTWVYQQTLLPWAPAPTASFGRSVAIDGGRIAVGAPGQFGPNGVGAVYIFREEDGTWVLEQKLDSPASGDSFGRDVALAGDTLVVGAPLDDQQAIDAGAVHVHRLGDDGWTHEAKLVATIANAADRLGWSVAIEGSTIAAGAYVADGAVVNSGAAHLFTKTGGAKSGGAKSGGAKSGGVWMEKARLLDPNGGSFDAFGWALALGPERLLVAAPAMNAPGPPTGGGALLFDIACALQSPTAVPDLNGDGVVDGIDLGLLLAAWGPCPEFLSIGCPADLDQDGAVGGTDLEALLASWGGRGGA